MARDCGDESELTESRWSDPRLEASERHHTAGIRARPQNVACCRQVHWAARAAPTHSSGPPVAEATVMATELA